MSDSEKFYQDYIRSH